LKLKSRFFLIRPKSSTKSPNSNFKTKFELKSLKLKSRFFLIRPKSATKSPNEL
jgi:hypothetical protein